MGCQVEGFQQGWECWVWEVTGGFGVPGWRGSQQGLECWAGESPGGILGLLMQFLNRSLKSPFFLLLSVTLLPLPSTAPSPQGRFHFLSLFNTLEANFREHWGHLLKFPSLILQGRSLCLVIKPERLQTLSCHMTLSNGLKNSSKCYETRKSWELACCPSRSSFQHRRELCYS